MTKFWGESIFPVFRKPFIGLTQIIWRWKAMENAQLFCIEIFFLINYGFKTNSNMVESSFEYDFFTSLSEWGK